MIAKVFDEKFQRFLKDEISKAENLIQESEIS